MIEKDLPAAFNYISAYTGKKIHYIGHSQGTLIMFGALSLHLPEVENNLATFSALGPVAYLTNQDSRLFTILTRGGLTEILMKLNMQQIFYSNNQKIYDAVAEICALDEEVCKFGLF